jgi:hypothetical protein
VSLPRLAWLVVALAVLQGGWLAFDGARALLVGDYVTPRSGPYAGQLGPWSKLVATVGLEPRSTVVKSVHVGLGLAWLALAAAFAGGLPGARAGLIACAVLTLWYLPFGTILSVIEIALLLLGDRHLIRP